jgi:hypothetical protein
MHTPRLPVVDWTDAPADLNGLVRFGERQNLVSARVPSHFKRSLPRSATLIEMTQGEANIPINAMFKCGGWFQTFYFDKEKDIPPFFTSQQLPVGQGLLIIDHTQTRNTRYDSSEQAIDSKQIPLPIRQHTTLTRKTSKPLAGFEPAIPASDRPQTHALDRAATGIDKIPIRMAHLREIWNDKQMIILGACASSWPPGRSSGSSYPVPKSKGGDATTPNDHLKKASTETWQDNHLSFPRILPQQARIHVNSLSSRCSLLLVPVSILQHLGANFSQSKPHQSNSKDVIFLSLNSESGFSYSRSILIPNVNKMTYHAILTMGVQQLQVIFGNGRTNLRGWHDRLGLGANDISSAFTRNS